MKGVLFCTYFSYADPLIQAYTLPYVRIIRNLIDIKFPVFLFTIEKSSHKLSYKEIKKVRDRLAAEGIFWVSLPYMKPGPLMVLWIPRLLFLLRIALRRDVSTIHGWCTPGGAIGLVLSKLSNKPLVLDSFEPHAEAMSETGTWSRTSIRFRALFRLEGLMARHSTFQICCTHSMIKYAQQRYKCTLSRPLQKPACVDFTRFNPTIRKNKRLLERLEFNEKIVCVYAGKFGGLYLREQFFEFVRVAMELIGDRFRLLLLSVESESNVQRWLHLYEIPPHVVKHVYVPHAEVPVWMGLADFAIAPYFPAPCRRHSAPIKVSEYWAIGLPTIITKDIAEDSFFTQKRRLGSVIVDLTREGYEKSVLDILELLFSEDREALTERISMAAIELKGFDRAENVYRQIYLSQADRQCEKLNCYAHRV